MRNNNLPYAFTGEIPSNTLKSERDESDDQFFEDIGPIEIFL